MHHDHRLGASERRLGRFGESMIERGFQRGIGWLNNVGAGNLAQERRRVRQLQRIEVASENIRLPRDVQANADEHV